jgi:integrase
MLPTMPNPRERGAGDRPWRMPDGRWRSRFVDDLGKRRSVYARSPKDAAAKRDEALRNRHLGTLIGGPVQTVGQFLDRWLNDVARHSLRPRSFERYAGIVRLHIAPHIGHMQLGRLTGQHLARLYADLADKHSGASVRYVHAVLHRALDQAVRWRLIQTNPADAADRPRLRTPEMRPLGPDEARRFLEAVQGDELEALYVLALATGMRQGELLGLRWQDVDLSGRQLQVRHTLSRMQGEWWLGPPKSERGVRSIALTGPTVELLRAHRLREAERLLLRKVRLWDESFVFSDEVGNPLFGRHVTQRYFYGLLREAGLRQIRFHDLRHSAATLLLASGVMPRVVSEMLGHADVAFTLGRYGHVLPTMQADAVRKLDILLGRGVG